MTLKVGILGGGWPGVMHSRGYLAAGGFAVVAVADPIPSRVKELATEWPKAARHDDGFAVLADASVEAVSICLPTHQHLPVALAALKAKKHVILESPPGLSVKEAKQLSAAATRAGKVLCYAMQRRFGGAELAAAQALEKDYAGKPQHARCTWMRTRGIPVGTGWYTDRAKSGGGVLVDTGIHVLDLGWNLLGRPAPATAFALLRMSFAGSAPAGSVYDVEDSAVAVMKFESGQSLELSVSWAINQAPARHGASVRINADAGAVEIYTPAGPTLYRSFDAKGNAKATPLKQPKIVGHAAMLRQFREAVQGRPAVLAGAEQGVVLMQMIEAMYKSAETGRSVEVKTSPATLPALPEPTPAFGG